MKNFISYAVFSVLALCFLFSQTLNGQTAFQSPISANDQVTTDIVYFGLDQLATNNVDSTVLPERELPPIGPTGVFDLRFINTPTLSTDLGQGVKYDFRGTVSPTQVDTFVLSCKNGSLTSPFTVSWEPGLGSVCGTLRMVDEATGGLIINVNMLYTTSVELPAGAGYDPTYNLYIIRTEAKPVLTLDPTSLDFGTVFLGAPESLPVTFDNTTGTEDLVISSLTSPAPTYTFDKATPWTIPAGTSDVLSVTFTPVVSGTVSGNIVVAHNAGDWSDVIPVTATSGDPGMYRSFTNTEIVSLDPIKLKLQKYVKRKPVSLEFEVQLTVPLHTPDFTTLHIEWGAAPMPPTLIKYTGTFAPQVVKVNDVELTLGVDYNLIGAIDGKNKKFDYVFSALNTGDVVNIHGYVKSKKPTKAKYWWLPVDVAAKEKIIKLALLPTDPAWLLNQPRLPMPSYGNVGLDIFPGVKLGGSGILVGSSTGDPKLTGWLMLNDAKSMWGTLRGKTGTHAGTPRNFDFLKLTKPFVKLQKKLPPEVHDNILMANLVTLKFNIIASQQENTPVGFGELIYHNEGNPLHGLTLGAIYDLASPKMTNKDDDFDYANCNAVLSAVNAAFSGQLDTVSFATKLVCTGVKTLSEVPFLRKGTAKAITVPAPAPYEMPEVFTLEQNYPNPFNPSTTIEFNIPEDAIVTLKIYNTLGQEVATLIDREELSEGSDYSTFDASSLSSGIYFYRLVAQGIESGVTSQMIKKMVLMK